DRQVITASPASAIADGSQFTITSASGGIATYEFESGYTLTIPETYELQVPIQGTGTGGITDGMKFSVNNGASKTIFEFDNNNNVSAGNTPITFVFGETQEQVTESIVSALQTAAIGLSPRNLGNGLIHLGTTSVDSANILNSSLKLSGVASSVVD